MQLTDEQVKNIAQLARLDLAQGEISGYREDLERILDLVEQMNSVDTQEVAPMAHPLDVSQRLRADEVTEPDSREEFQAIAPVVSDGLYLVPKVIE